MNKLNSSLPGLASWEKPSLKLHLLSKVDIFRDLSQEEIHEIEGMVNMVTCKKGHVLYRPEEDSHPQQSGAGRGSTGITPWLLNIGV